MKTSIMPTIAAVALAATASAGILQAAEEQQAVQPVAPAYGYIGPYAPYGFHPRVPPYGYGYGYHHAPWAWNPWAQERAMIEHAEAIHEWAEQQMRAEREWMEQQSLARQAPMEHYRRWREAESDAWHRWVDPYGAWLDDMRDWRDAQWDAWAEARRHRYDRYRPHHRVPPAADETGQLAQEQTAAESTGETAK